MSKRVLQILKNSVSQARTLSASATAPYFKIVEVGPRDGLQNEKTVLPTSDKLKLIEKLGMCGLRTIETTSFVSAKRVPQMADHVDLVARLDKLRGVAYPVLVPNMEGLQSVIGCGVVKDIAVFCAASDSFSRKNVNCSLEESLKKACDVTRAGKAAGLNVRGYISCVVNCAYEGSIKPGVVAGLAEKLLQAGCYEISLGDTTGAGGAGSVGKLLDTLNAANVPTSQLAVHFHDTYGQALANILVAIEKGIRVADSSVSGLGGCPFARGASGNVATEDLVYMLHDLGFETGVNLKELISVSNWICARLNRAIHSKVTVACLSKSKSS